MAPAWLLRRGVKPPLPAPAGVTDRAAEGCPSSPPAHESTAPCMGVSWLAAASVSCEPERSLRAACMLKQYDVRIFTDTLRSNVLLLHGWLGIDWRRKSPQDQHGTSDHQCTLETWILFWFAVPFLLGTRPNPHLGGGRRAGDVQARHPQRLAGQAQAPRRCAAPAGRRHEACIGNAALTGMQTRLKGLAGAILFECAVL